MRTLRERYATGDFRSPASCPTLKGTAGTLGTSQIQALAVELEANIREQVPVEEIERLASILEAEQPTLTIARLTALPKETQAPPSEADRLQARELLDQLELFLSKNA